MANDTVQTVGYAGDPLTEPTRQARLEAAMRKRGYTITEFARALNVRWQTVQDWFAGRTPNLDAFIHACELVQYSMLDIVYGYERPNSPRQLSADGIKRLFAELNTPAALRTAFAQHQESPEGRYQDYSRAYVCGWLNAFAAAIRAGAQPTRAHEVASIAALNEHALAVAAASHVRPIDTSDLAAAVAAAQPRRKRKTTDEPKLKRVAR